jgi:hypothetical protein
MTGEAMFSYAVASLIGIALALSVFPLDFLFPVSPLPGPLPEGDMAQHVVGQRYFIADVWRWHLLTVPDLGAPQGVNIGLTDSIPLIALILKALAPWLPTGFHGIGLWYGISWVLQPVAAVWCLRATGETRWLPALCMALISIGMPAWWNRFGHAALTSHFLLLCALGTYFILVRRGSTSRWLAATALLCATILVHPYLFVMNAAVIAAVPLTLMLRKDVGWWKAAAGTAGAMLISLLLIGWLGYLGTRGEGGFGRFAMNLLSPIWPADSWLFTPTLPKVHAGTVSGWEGYNYLGAGLLGGLVLTMTMFPRQAWVAARRHAGLVLTLLGLTVLALSNRIGIGYSHAFELYHPPFWLDAFRSSGRFFWPVAYALALTVVLAFCRIRNEQMRARLLLAVAALQFVDITGLRNSVAMQLRAPPRPWLVDAGTLRPLFATHRSLVLLPRWECLGTESGKDQQAIELEILTLASETTIPVNTMYEARWHRTADCDMSAQARVPLNPGEVRVLLPHTQDSLRPLIPDGDRLCHSVGSLVVCSDDRPSHVP